jgi:hypothetical protein
MARRGQAPQLEVRALAVSAPPRDSSAALRRRRSASASAWSRGTCRDRRGAASCARRRSRPRRPRGSRFRCEARGHRADRGVAGAARCVPAEHGHHAVAARRRRPGRPPLAVAPAVSR